MHVCMCACRYRPECKVGCHSSKPYNLFTETKVTNGYDGWPARPRDPPIFTFLSAEMRLQAYTAAPRSSLHDKHFTNWANSLILNMALFVSFGCVHPVAPLLGWLAVLLTDFTPFAIMTVLIYILISNVYMLALETKPFIHIYLCVNKRILLVVCLVALILKTSPQFWKSDNSSYDELDFVMPGGWITQSVNHWLNSTSLSIYNRAEIARITVDLTVVDNARGKTSSFSERKAMHKHKPARISDDEANKVKMESHSGEGLKTAWQSPE